MRRRWSFLRRGTPDIGRSRRVLIGPSWTSFGNTRSRYAGCTFLFYGQTLSSEILPSSGRRGVSRPNHFRCSVAALSLCVFVVITATAKEPPPLSIARQGYVFAG